MNGKEGPSRREVLTGAVAAGVAAVLQSETVEAEPGAVAVTRLEMNEEQIREAVKATVQSLANGMSQFQGRRVNPRITGFAHHPELIEHLADGLELLEDVPEAQRDAYVQRNSAEVVERIEQDLQAKRIEILPIDESDIAIFNRPFNKAMLQKWSTERIKEGEVGAVVYLSSDRTFQRFYAVKKTATNILQLSEAYRTSTSRREPVIPGHDPKATPLGMFEVPRDGVRIALLGEVTKFSHPEVTRRLFIPITIDGQRKYFVRTLNETAEEEIVTVVGDRHLLYSPTIAGDGFLIHDTTEMRRLGQSASTGCIRTPAVRRFTMLTAENKHPTQVLVLWEDHDPETMGWGSDFPVTPDMLQPRRKR